MTEERDRARSLRSELATKERSLEDLERRLASSLVLVADLRKQRISVVPTEESPVVENPTPTQEAEEPSVGLNALEEATPIFEELIGRGDLEGLWLLAADLLRLGEPGYEKIIELAAELGPRAQRDSAIELLWKSEDLLLGRFFADATSSVEDLLGFTLHLQEKSPGELPKPIKELREAAYREIGIAMLGIYRGNDRDLLGRYVELHRGVLEPRGSPQQGRREGQPKDSIRALGQIPTEESTDILLELLENPELPQKLQEEVVRSLAWQRNDRALPALRARLQKLTGAHISKESDRLRETVSAAVRYLE